MIFAISVFLKNYSMKTAKRKFDKEGNKVLCQKEIYSLLENNLPENLSILESAVVSHNEVNGTKYYTRYPQDAHLGHNNFRKASIAYELGKNIENLVKSDLPKIISILKTLSPLTQDYNPTKIIAWDTLGKLTKEHPKIYDQEEKRLKEALKGQSTIDALGGMIFLKKISKRKNIEPILTESLNLSKNNYSKAMFLNYLYSNFGEKNIDEKNLNSNLKTFFTELKKGYKFDSEEFYEGLELSGIIKKSGFPLWENTPHKKVINDIMQISGEFLPVIGAFSLKKYL